MESLKDVANKLPTSDKIRTLKAIEEMVKVAGGSVSGALPQVIHTWFYIYYTNCIISLWTNMLTKLRYAPAYNLPWRPNQYEPVRCMLGVR